MHSGTMRAASSTSSAVVRREMLKRTLPCATRGGMPIARSTGDGSSEPLEHAAPALAAIPRSERSRRIASASSPGNPMFVVF